MKTLMKTAALSAALMLGGYANAQSTAGTTTPARNASGAPIRVAPEWAPLDVAGMTKELGLSTDQVKKISAIDSRYTKEYNDVVAALGGTDKAKGSPRVTSLLERRDTEVRGNLTPEQLKQWITVHGDTRTVKPATVEKQPVKAAPSKP